MNIVGIIPARMGSSRFPGKPMAEIHGFPMIGHVFKRTQACSLLTNTYVATCDREIYDFIISIGGQAVMTLPTHERCTDRTAEAMLKIEAATGRRTDIVVMVQGDEPMVTPDMIHAAVQPLQSDPALQIVNLMAHMKRSEDFEDPNEVKVVVGLSNQALYFSREPIPSRKKGAHRVPMLKQVCIIPFRREYLISFNQMPQTPLEIIESVDMMRIIEHGGRVQMVLTDTETYSVDTPEDLQRVVCCMKPEDCREYSM